VSRLRPQKLHVRFRSGVSSTGPIASRRYTLTHSDATGDLFLTVGTEYDRKQISGWYTRLMRDEVLAEWREDEEGPALHVHCHLSGGLILGTARWRYEIFRHELPLVLEAFRFGDRQLYEAHPALDEAPIRVHFAATRRRYRRTERWGTPADFRL
jgi:hypothetical protein